MSNTKRDMLNILDESNVLWNRFGQPFCFHNHTCNQASSEGANIIAARRCKINKPWQWWNISNCVSPKLFEEPGLMERSSINSFKFDLSGNGSLNCWESFPPSNFWLRTWLWKEAVKELIQKHGIILWSSLKS